MTLAQKILWKNAALIAALVLVAVAALAGLRTLRDEVTVALEMITAFAIPEPRLGLLVLRFSCMKSATP